MKVLGIVPARFGSKGVPGKNVRELCGKPLIYYVATAGLQAKSLYKVILSTDSPDIAAVGREVGLEVPFLRPAELAKDDSPTYPVIMHALDELEEVYDAVCLLQPVCPMIKSATIDGCVQKMIDCDADTVVTTVAIPQAYNPYFAYFQDDSGSLEYALGGKTLSVRRQDVPHAVIREGSVYLSTVDTLRSKQSIFGDRIIGYEVDHRETVNIDSASDWREAERKMNLIRD